MGYVYNEVAITTDSSGNATVYTPYLKGKLLAIVYKPGSSQIATGADLTITMETTLQPVLIKANAGTSTVVYRPKIATNLNTDGSALTDYEPPVAVNERIKTIVAEGGDTKTGAIGFITERNDVYL
jgi:hypothetical protein